MLPSEGSATNQPADTGAGSDSAENTVVTMSLKFMPTDITVKAGTTVTWKNGETIGHTITSGAWGDVNESTGLRGSQTPDGMFDHKLSPKGQEGDTFSFTFDTPGEYLYYCQPHLTMNAKVIVEP
jgi:plastocyanin